MLVPRRLCGGLIPQVHPQVLSCVCPCGIIPTMPCVTSSSLREQPPRHPETFCLDHLRCWAAYTPLIASNPLWYTRPWLVDTRLIDETLLTLMSASIDKHAQPQAINKVEGTASCVMTCRMTQPLAACRCDDCLITTAQSSL